MFAHFFITRPVFAMVISVLVVLAGILALTQLPIAQYPEVVPPQVVVTAIYPGADAADRLRDRRRPDRGAGQRRRGDDVHGVAVHQRRRDAADRHVQARHQPGHGPGARPEPRRHRHPEAPGGRPPARRRHQEAIHRHPAGRQPVLEDQGGERPGGVRAATRGQPARQPPGEGRTGPHRGRRRRVPVRQPRLRDAGLARPGEDERPEPARRATWWTRSASRTCRWPPGRSASRRRRRGRTSNS